MASSPTPPAKKPHIYEIDLIRAFTVFSVVAIHSLSYTSSFIASNVGKQWYNLLIHSLHYNREIFMFVTGLVLIYVYYHRPFSTKNFWLKRTMLVVVPYILWTAIYTILNNHGLSALGYFKLTLINSITGNASFQLYYILLSIQFYLIFPLFLLFMKKNEHRPWKALAVSLVIQLIFIFFDFHYLQMRYSQLPRSLQIALNYQDRFVFVYQFFFVLGGFAGLYIDQGRRFVSQHARVVAAVFFGSLLAYSGFYFFQLNSLHQSIQLTTTVLQPSVNFYSIAVILFFAWITTRWVKKMYGYKIVHAISETSFGIYFVHVLALSLITQYLLPLTPSFVPIFIRIIGVLLLAFTTSTLFCYGLLRTPALSWTIGRAQSVGRPIKTIRLWIANTSWYKKIILLLAGTGTAIFIIKTPLPVIHPAPTPPTLSYTYSSYRFTQHPQTPTFEFQNDSIKNSAFVINRPLQSTGCTTTSPLQPGTATTVEILSGAQPRVYRVYIPLRYHNTLPHVLVLNFHGYASNAFRQERISHFDQLANQKDSIIVYPQGTPDSNRLLGWNTGLHPSIKSNDVLFVSNLLNQLQSHLCVNPSRIYATGFSNGGGFVNELACSLSGRIAAFAPVSGSYVSSFQGCASNRPVSLIEFHGTADHIVPYNGNRRDKEYSVSSWAGDWAKHDKCHQNPTVITDSNQIIAYKWSGCEDQASVVHYKLLGVHHVWPSLHFSLTTGHQTHNTNISNLIWDFFEQHPLYNNTPTSI